MKVELWATYPIPELEEGTIRNYDSLEEALSALSKEFDCGWFVVSILNNGTYRVEIYNGYRE